MLEVCSVCHYIQARLEQAELEAGTEPSGGKRRLDENGNIKVSYGGRLRAIRNICEGGECPASPFGDFESISDLLPGWSNLRFGAFITNL